MDSDRRKEIIDEIKILLAKKGVSNREAEEIVCYRLPMEVKRTIRMHSNESRFSL